MGFQRDEVTLTVPASSANLGPGYDTMGLALQMRDTVTVRATTGATHVTVEGEGAGEVPTDDSNLVVQALRAGLESAGAPQVGVEMRCCNRIPHGRGLGSSSAAIVAGLSAAGALLGGEALTQDDVFQLAVQMEGHPDNAAPTVYGKAVVGWMETSETGTPRAYARTFEVHPDICVTVLIPHFELATSKARNLLPDTVPHRDAAFNVSRAALLPLALSAYPELLFYATEDRLHQEYRRVGMPESLKIVDKLRAAGIPAAISGAGPSVIVFNHLDPASRQDFERLGWHPEELSVATEGVIIS